MLGQLVPLVCSVAHEPVLCCSGPDCCIAPPRPPAGAGAGASTCGTEHLAGGDGQADPWQRHHPRVCRHRKRSASRRGLRRLLHPAPDQQLKQQRWIGAQLLRRLGARTVRRGYLLSQVQTAIGFQPLPPGAGMAGGGAWVSMKVAQLLVPILQRPSVMALDGTGGLDCGASGLHRSMLLA